MSKNFGHVFALETSFVQEHVVRITARTRIDSAPEDFAFEIRSLLQRSHFTALRLNALVILYYRTGV